MTGKKKVWVGELLARHQVQYDAVAHDFSPPTLGPRSPMSTCDTHHVAPLSGPQGLGQQVPVGCRPPFQIWLKDGNKLTIGNLARCNGVIKMGATHPEIYHGSGISRYTSRSWSCCSNLNLKRPQMGWSVSLLPWTCCFHRPTQGWYRNSPRHHKLWVCNLQRHRRNPNWMHHPDSQPSPGSV